MQENLFFMSDNSHNMFFSTYGIYYISIVYTYITINNTYIYKNEIKNNFLLTKADYFHTFILNYLSSDIHVSEDVNIFQLN